MKCRAATALDSTPTETRSSIARWARSSAIFPGAMPPSRRTASPCSPISGAGVASACSTPARANIATSPVTRGRTATTTRLTTPLRRRDSATVRWLLGVSRLRTVCVHAVHFPGHTTGWRPIRFPLGCCSRGSRRPGPVRGRRIEQKLTRFRASNRAVVCRIICREQGGRHGQHGRRRSRKPFQR